MGESDSDQDPYAPPEAGLEGEGSELGRVDLYRAFISGTEAQAARTQKDATLDKELIGPSDVERYLERFHRRDEVGGIRPGWHWPALFVVYPWLVYRRMYLVLVLYVVLPPIVIGVLGVISGILFPGLIETELSPQDVPLGVVILMVTLGIPYYFFRQCTPILSTGGTQIA